MALKGGELHELEGAEALAKLPGLVGKPDCSVWVDLVAPTPRQAQQVGEALGLHPLIVEDVLEGNQRAKIETTDGVVHIVLFHLSYGDDVVASELDIVLGDGFPADRPRRRLGPAGRPPPGGRARAGPQARAGPPAVGDRRRPRSTATSRSPTGSATPSTTSRTQVVRKATPDTVEQLFKLKRELIQVRRAISPVREVFNQLTNRDVALIDDDEIVYFRDIYDHVIRLTDELDNYRELASATLDVYLTQVNNNLSVIMKRLTGVTVILAGIGAVAGIFGMSEAGTALGGGGGRSGSGLSPRSSSASPAVAAVVLRRIDWI